jgi:hypothetical protein
MFLDEVPFFSQFSGVATDNGSLTFTAMRNATFQATVLIPEPCTSGLLIVALGALALRRRRREA